MARWRKILAVALVVLVPVSLQGRATVEVSAVKELVVGLGESAEVKVRLWDGKRYGGPIQSIHEEGFELVANADQTQRLISYESVAELKLASPYYKAKDSPKPSEAHRTAVGLGIGKHIMVKLGDGRKIHGNIMAINAESFLLLPDHQQNALLIPYNDTWQLQPNLSRGTKALIWVVVGLGALFVILGATGQLHCNNNCGWGG